MNFPKFYRRLISVIFITTVITLTFLGLVERSILSAASEQYKRAKSASRERTHIYKCNEGFKADLHKNKELVHQSESATAENVLASERTNMTFGFDLNSNTLDVSTPLNSLNDKHKLPKCRIDARNLRGRSTLRPSVTASDVRLENVIRRVKHGGVYRPKNCTSKESIAVIIPYRDRETHLEIIVNVLHDLLQRQNKHYGIYVVEMDYPVQFNRGLLANAGFQTAHSIGNYSCYIIHDVDLIPVNDYNLYECGSNPIHMSAQSSRWKSGLPYQDYVGGVVALSAEQYMTINGFSNLYFGWGGEDDDLCKRIVKAGMMVDRKPDHIGVYMAMPHKDDSANPPNPYRDMLLSQAEYRMTRDGLNSMSYHRTSLEFRPLYTWILIRCVENEVFESYSNMKVNPQMLVKDRKTLKLNGKANVVLYKYNKRVLKLNQNKTNSASVTLNGEQ